MKHCGRLCGSRDAAGPPDELRDSPIRSTLGELHHGLLVYCPLINWTVPVHGVAQMIVVWRLRTLLELGRPRKTMACPTLRQTATCQTRIVAAREEIYGQ